VDIKESIKSVALEFFQSSKTFYQNLIVKSKSLTRLGTSHGALAKGRTKGYCKIDSKITTNFVKTCGNTPDVNTKFEQFDSWLGATRDKNSRPCKTIE